MIEQLKGPIMVLGASGFIGVNLLHRLLAERSDVYGVSRSPHGSWRFLECKVPRENLVECDVTEVTLLRPMLKELRPATVFQLSAYGAYSKQREYRKTHLTNFNGVVDCVEILKEIGFSAFVQAGSNSEYGLNAAGPSEDSELLPNSHYAVSKVAAHYALKYYGKREGLPVVNLRVYSAYGPWEEPDRLVPQLLSQGRQGGYPKLSQGNISRDFVHVDDVCSAFILAALRAEQYRGEAFNIGTGHKTTLKEMAELVRAICHIEAEPECGTMPNREWDVVDWYGDPSKAQKLLDWQAQVPLREGLERTLRWQQEVDFDQALWNWTRS